jgi:molybdopterin-guanine dinucleotide biosynthesis protein A
MGGDKLIVQLDGRPLIGYVLAAMRAVLQDVAVIAKADTKLPNLPGVSLWIEPDEPVHPLLGIAEALGLSAGRPVLCCPGDMPLIKPALLARLATTAPGRSPAVVAAHEGRLQPLVGCFWPAAVGLLASAARRGAPARDAVSALSPQAVEVPDPMELFNVNTPDDLLQASALLSRR